MRVSKAKIRSVIRSGLFVGAVFAGSVGGAYIGGEVRRDASAEAIATAQDDAAQARTEYIGLAPDGTCEAGVLKDLGQTSLANITTRQVEDAFDLTCGSHESDLVADAEEGLANILRANVLVSDKQQIQPLSYAADLAGLTIGAALGFGFALGTIGFDSPSKKILRSNQISAPHSAQ